MSSRWTNQTGVSLVETLVALAIGGLVLTGLNKFITNNMKANKHIELRSQIESTRRIVSKTFSCEHSLGVSAGVIVTACDPLPIKNLKNQTIVDDLGRVGSTNVYIRKRCESGVGLFFEYQLATAENGSLVALADPLNGQKSGYRELFPAEAFCTEYFYSQTSPTGAPPAADPTKSFPDISCAAGRALVGLENGLPVCANSDEDLRDPPTCTLPASGASGGSVGINIQNVGGGPVGSGSVSTTGGGVSTSGGAAITGVPVCTAGKVRPQPSCSFKKALVNGVDQYVESCP